MADVEMVSIEALTPDRATLRVKTTLKGAQKPERSEEDSLPAVLEDGAWKIDLSALTRNQIATADRRAALFAELTQAVDSGKISDRVSAFVAAMKAASATAPGGRP